MNTLERDTNMTTLRNIREKITDLESEKADLMAEVEKLRKKAESMLASLEKEVEELREEADSLKELLESQ
jgi:peptidoglycan hydrolase CwlO-like protein